jgi:TRAP transporter 4TM/12TM fusion protein
MVHLEAAKNRLDGLPKEQCPSAWTALKRQWFLIVPLAVLVYLLLFGFTPMFSGTVGLAATAIVILGNPLSARLPGLAWRALFWILMGLLCSSFLTFGIDAFVIIIAGLVGAVALLKGGRETLRICVQALVEGARSAVPVGIACALVGTIVGTLTLTGLAGTVTNGIVALAGDSLFLTLLLAMIASLILGMGIPTIPNYIITSSLVAPILLKMGVPLIVSHMFVFYFGIMADLTPPVALAAFAAATIAKSSFMRTGFNAVKIAIAGFVVPYMAVYDNALMLQTDDVGAVLYVVFKALVAITLWGAAAVGHLIGPMGWIERIVATVAAFSLVLAIPITDEIGFGLAAAIGAWHYWRSRGAAKPAKA